MSMSYNRTIKTSLSREKVLEKLSAETICVGWREWNVSFQDDGVILFSPQKEFLILDDISIPVEARIETKDEETIVVLSFSVVRRARRWFWRIYLLFLILLDVWLLAKIAGGLPFVFQTEKTQMIAAAVFNFVPVFIIFLTFMLNIRFGKEVKKQLSE